LQRSNFQYPQEAEMAARRHDPTVANRKQIKSKFRKIFDGKLEFVSIRNMQSWYGRHDDVAAEKLEMEWKQFWEAQDWDPGRAPKLFVVGPISGLNGYAVGRRDKETSWLY
jgi:hypothetical protein